MRRGRRSLLDSVLAIRGVEQRKFPLKGKQKEGDDLFNEHLLWGWHIATLREVKSFV